MTRHQRTAAAATPEPATASRLARQRLQAVTQVKLAPVKQDTITRLSLDEVVELHKGMADVEKAQRAAEADAEKLFFG